MSDEFITLKVKLGKDEWLALRDNAQQNYREPAIQVRHILRTVLLTERPTKLEHIAAPPTVEDFNALIDCINALAEMVAHA